MAEKKPPKNDQMRAKRTRKQLLGAAERVFLEEGYHRATIARIVAETGVAQGTFYHHFASKRAIFSALLEEFSRDLIEEFAQMKEQPPANLADYRGQSLAALSRVAGIVEGRRETVQLLLREASSIDREFEEQVGDFLQQFAEIASEYLDHAIRGRFARSCRTDVVGQCIVGIGLRLMTVWLEGRIENVELGTLLTEAVDFAFYGMATRESPLPLPADSGRAGRKS